MSITSALYAGASGISGMSKAIQVIGNNIANIGTVGFKGSRAEFADLLSQAVNTPGGKKQIGRGVRIEAVQGLFHQGSFESTPVVTDVAINGAGFFTLSNERGDMFYTRAGQFRIDNEGMLTNAIGMKVQGFLFDASGQSTGEVGDVNLSSITAPPNPTGDGISEGTGVFMNLNVGATAGMDEDGVFTPKTWDISDPAGTSNFSTSFTVYDSLGVGHTVVNYLVRTSVADAGAGTDNEWEWHALVDGGEIVGGTPGVFEEEASGTLTFDTNGALISDPEAFTASEFNFTGGATQNQQIGFDFSGTTQVGPNPSVVNAMSQDGYSSGFLQSIDISRDGVIQGVFSNGVARDLAQFALASFPAETELFRTGNSLFVETVASGQGVLATANTGTNGSIAASTLELSNVDLSEEFVKLITTQRAFQANTKVITAGDQLLETVINMKR